MKTFKLRAYIMNIRPPITTLETATSWRQIMNGIFHLLGNKLLFITNMGNLLKVNLPHLLKGYNLAVENQLMAPAIHPKLVEVFSRNTNLADAVEPMLEIMDSVLSMCKGLCSIHSTLAGESIPSLITTLFNTFEFKNNNQALIEVHLPADAAVVYPALFLNTLVLHFLNFFQDNFNALARRMVIRFSTENKNGCSITFNITSPDTHADYDFFFKSTVTEQAGKTLPGMEFCRLACLYRGGNMMYKVVEKESVECVVLIPAHQEISL